MPTTAEPDPRWLEFCNEHPCPTCGANPVSFESRVVEEYRFAPRDDEGRPMLYAPYEMGETRGMRSERSLVCLNNHIWYMDDQIQWLDKPFTGPPLVQL